MKLSEIAALVGGALEGDGEIEINNIGKIESAGPGEITFIANPAYEKFYSTAKAGAIIVSLKFDPVKVLRNDKRVIPLIRVKDPYLAFIQVLDKFSPQSELQKVGIHESAVVADSAEISNEEVRIGAGCFIGEKCEIGKKSIDTS